MQGSLGPWLARMAARVRARWRRVLPPSLRGNDYAERLRAEQAIFASQVDINNLPGIFHYWSDGHMRPMFEEVGFSHPEGFFAHFLGEAIARRGDGVAKIASVGAGNGDTEARIARRLLDAGHRDFVIECLDINADCLARAEALAQAEGLSPWVRTTRLDFNHWRPMPDHAAVMANQSLHHVVELETLFDAIDHAIGEHGLFVTSDMIGRNGHQRWPEALTIVREFWRELPRERRYNVQLRRQETEFLDWDCSGEGFEGIRAQDILPLLIERFGFRFFFAFGNVIDPFVDRSFGHHFSADSAEDRALIDRIHARDVEEILAGRIKPTHMMAVMQRDRTLTPTCWRHLTPEFCVRRP